MPTNYTRGLATERRLIEELRADGYETIRAAASKGPVDVIAIRADAILLCSVKRSKTWRGAARVHKKERAALLALPVPRTPKVRRVLAVWSDTLGPEEAGRGGMWYCMEHIKESA